MTKFKNYFYGNEISDYGKENGFVDYRTFAKAFEAVLANDLIAKTDGVCGYWEQESGFVDYSDEIEEAEEKVEELEENEEENADKIARLRDKIEEMENAQEYPPEIFQYYIIDENGARICEEFNEIVFYNSELDIYLWGVTHWGTAWDYVLTDIPCEK